MATLIFGIISGLIITGWLLVLVWSGFATRTSFSKLAPALQTVLVGSWVLLFLGAVLHYFPFLVIGDPLVGIGAAGIVYGLIGHYPGLTQRARALGAGALIIGIGVEIVSEGFLSSLPGPYTLATPFFLVGWLFLQTLFGFKDAPLLKRLIYVASWLALLFSILVPILALPAVLALAMFLPPPAQLGTSEAIGRMVTRVGYFLAISLLIGAILGAIYAIRSTLYYLLGFAGLGVILSIAVFFGVYSRKRVVLVLSGLALLAVTPLGFFGFYLLPVAVAVLALGLMVQRRPEENK